MSTKVMYLYFINLLKEGLYLWF